MTRPPSAAQRRVINDADPVTGRLRGTEAQLSALVKRGLAFRHPRPPHDHFLTPAGHRTRESPPAAEHPGVTPPEAPAGTAPPPAGRTPAGGGGGPAGGGATAAGTGAPQAPPPSGVFAARVGGEEEASAPDPARAREVHSAWQGLLELRRMTSRDGATDRPCDWERTHLVRAAALALEADGHHPAGTDGPGYRVRATPQPEAVAVYAAELRACAATLERAGWQAGEYTEPRTRARYLLASPRRA
ncbi:hypothetical protein ACIPRD_17350 [Streptomyces sp. NPDC090108]|uniref:hypothetical protein n=1 Tax=Streptomyces sp. NPDC090108 TaxID=3365947 RepID=UPI003807E1E6